MRVLITFGSFKGYEGTIVALNATDGTFTVRIDHLGSYRTYTRSQIVPR